MGGVYTRSVTACVYAIFMISARWRGARRSQHGRAIAAKRLISAPRSTRIRDAAEQAPFFKGWLNIPHFIELLINPGPLEGFLVAERFPFFGLDALKHLCGNQNFTARSRHRRDACSMAWRCRFLTARRSQDGRVIAEK